MKKVFVFTYTILLATAAGTAFAEPVQVQLDKEQLNVNFNNMIDEGQAQKKDMTTDLSSRMPEEQSEIAPQAMDLDKKKVIDFIDVEVGFGNGPDSVVDRRFDSVSDTGLIDLKALVPNYLGTGT